MNWLLFIGGQQKLKSDHCGIEIFKAHALVEKLNKVKIRPLWDWNTVKPIKLIQYLLLKSDHCGIEIVLLFVLLQALSRLKSDHCGIEIWKRRGKKRNDKIVKIRPLWDWNNDRNEKDIYHKRVKIRPLWDWNTVLFQQKNILNWVKIRPLWDWNMFMLLPMLNLQ